MVVEEKAFSEVYNEHAPKVTQFLRARGRKSGRPYGSWEVSELLQRTFLVTHRKLPDFRGESSLRTFIIGIARNIAREYDKSEAKRRNRQDAGSVVIEDIAAGEESPSASAENRDLLAKLGGLLKQFPVEEREIWVLVRVNELRLREVREITGLSEPTISRMFRRIEAKLVSLMNKADGAVAPRNFP